jgi:inner membrane protein
MDTATHFVMGLGLFGLAQIDPALAKHPETAQAVFLGTVIGSEIPDMDTLYRFKGNAAYIRHHRGWTHSLPMLLIWPTAVTGILTRFFPEADWIHVWLWTFLAVFIHVFIDLFNPYGTQAFLPFSRKWISLNVLNIFDPFIFSAHLAAFVLWWLKPDLAGELFAVLYAILALYIAWRSRVRALFADLVHRSASAAERITVIPTARWSVWNVIVEWPDHVKLGEIRKGELNWTGDMDTRDLAHPAAEASRKAEPIDAFLSFTSYGYPRVLRRPFGYEVRWLDVRYHHKKHFPFVAVALLDHHYHPLHSFVGWMKEEQLERKVRHLLSYKTGETRR